MPPASPTLIATPPATYLRRGWMTITLIGVVAYLRILSTHMSPHAGGSDSSGYLTSARLLAQGQFFAPVRSLPEHSSVAFGTMAFQPLGLRLHPTGDSLVPTYPIGLPLHLGAAAQIVGWDYTVIAVNLLSILASGGLLWTLARQLGLSPLWSAAGVLWLWLCPVFIFSALQPMSDLLALAWSLAVLSSVLRVRDDWRWGIACGAALSLAVLVRPTSALLVFPVLIALGFQWRAYLAVGAGGLPGAALFAFYNWKVYGSPLVTGYGEVWSAFGRDYFVPNLLQFARWIPVLFSPLIIAALAAPFLPTARLRGYKMLAIWFVTLVGFYGFYYCAGETWWYLRFILPAFPALILAALSALAATEKKLRLTPKTTAVAAAALLAISAAWQIRAIQRLDVMTLEQRERSYPDSARWAQTHLPANAAVFCMQTSGALFYYSNFLVIRWDQDPSDSLLNSLAAQKRPIYAALLPFESAAALKNIGGRWIKLSTVGQVTFWERQP
ncbi:MAG: glycosyltransferase family 39 protein [Opitutae bacterium]|nr:glycosyltransferase family 39 protein [Opitutae bacterium]